MNDLNRDPITDEPGSHPVGTSVGALGGAATGATIGAMFGPIGALIGGGIGAVAGGGAGHAVAESINPTLETEYWRGAHTDRAYYDSDLEFDRDYLPAYQKGWETRSKRNDIEWDDRLEAELKENWAEFRGESRLQWERAKGAVRDAFDRTDDTYNTYNKVDTYHEQRLTDADYFDDDFTFDDYRPAYRYGAYRRSVNPGMEWDDKLEAEMSSEWNEFKGKSRLQWEKAKDAVRDGWHSVERALPGDFDNDGR